MNAQKLSSDVASVGVTRPGGHGFCDVGRCWVGESRRLLVVAAEIERCLANERSSGAALGRGREPKLVRHEDGLMLTLLLET